ncbi:MAG: aminotransferase class V-fold PLP-dependent enzyme [Oscillospiraceae bacterium]|nr:aminotransferase class V-fold PLP-dependent enzyme [Oscillospiraceae bacterium]
MNDTPFFQKIERLSQSKTRFHVPGHKGNITAIPKFAAILPYDITEIEGADNLQNPTAELAQSQENMAKLYQSGATLYSANGSTSCIEAMLNLFLCPKDKIIIARNCHISAVRAMGFIGAEPIWLYPQKAQPQALEIEKLLWDTDAKTVYITSPDYYGNMADISSIRRACDRHNAILLVDNAHGAHLKFLPQDIHPLTLGADACTDSAHKTLPCLTGAAMLHLKNAALAKRARQLLNRYSSTSPSYLILASLDSVCGGLKNGIFNFAHITEQVSRIREEFCDWILPVDDPFKITLCPEKIGYTTTEINKELVYDGIYPEFVSDRYIVLMASTSNTNIDFSLLSKILKGFTPKAPLVTELEKLSPPTIMCNLREAMFAPSIEVNTCVAAGRIAATVQTPCPPGIPVVVPGEKITPNIVRMLMKSGILTVDVVK